MWRTSTVARSVVTVLVPPVVLDAGLLALYFRAPLNGAWTVRTSLALVVGLLLIAILVAWQIRVVARSPYPRLRAVAVAAFSFPVLILLFATSYYLMAMDEPGAFSEALDRVGSLYFTMTVFSTVGFGDIVARTRETRVAVIVQILVDLVYLGLLARALVEAARIGADRNAAGGTRDD
jgi:hypothetical protein